MNKMTYIIEGKEDLGTFIETGITKGWVTLKNLKTGEETKTRRNKMVEAGEIEVAVKSMAGTMARYKNSYEHTKSYSGKSSQTNGDEVAAMLEGHTPKEACEAAEILLGMETDTLYARYEHLNAGQIRMNAGNRIRAAVKNGEIDLDTI